MLDDHFPEQINKFSTRENNILDLVISSIPNNITVSDVLKPSVSEISTDHNAIFFELMTVYNPLPKVKRSDRADFDGLRAYFRSINLEEKISDHGDINRDWLDRKNAFSESVKMFVPVKNLNGRKFLPWMNNTILDLGLIKKKKSLRNRIKRNGSPSEYLRNKFKNLRS